MKTDKSGFSIVMSVYDQAPDLEANLPAFLTQEYEPGYEVIVVDETSTDNTEDVLKILKNDYQHLYTTFLPKPNRQIVRRKLAINIGTKAAKNEWVIITKIENAPTAPDILEAISQVLDRDAELTLGYMGKKGIRLQPFDTIEEAGNYLLKAERKLRKVFQRSKQMGYFWGRYDFIILPKKNIVKTLAYYEQKVSWMSLVGIRLSILWQSLIRRSSTTLLVTQ